MPCPGDRRRSRVYYRGRPGREWGNPTRIWPFVDIPWPPRAPSRAATGEEGYSTRMARALLLSLLVRQHMALKEKFRAKYPHPWLVWEAGAWNVPEVVEGNVAATRLPLTDLRDCLPAGDALCFELVGQTDGSPLRLGRASNNALVVNDATVSREQLHLSPTLEGRWTVTRVAASRTVTLGGTALEPEQPAVLQPGVQLHVGDVRLTFHEAEDFDERIGRIAAQVLAQTATPR